MASDVFQSWYSCVDNPIVWCGYRWRRKSIWFSSSSWSSVGYMATQWLIASGMLRFVKKVTRSSMSFSEHPPVETITGRRTLAIFSSRYQSFRSELATLSTGMPSSTHRSTDDSSKAVAIGMQPPWRIAWTRRAILLGLQHGVHRLLDVANVRPRAEILVDERLHVPELELDRRAHVVEADDAGVGVDDLQAALDAPEVVVGHLEDEQIFEHIAFNHDSHLIRTAGAHRARRRSR